MAELNLEKRSRDRFALCFHFAVSFSNVPGLDPHADLSFMSVGGLESELQVEEVVEGGQNHFVHRLPKQTKYSNLVLKRAMNASASSLPLLKWAESAVNDHIFTLSNVEVTLLDGGHNSLKKWIFYDAYPVKLGVSGLDANKDELVIETLEMAYKYFTAISSYH